MKQNISFSSFCDEFITYNRDKNFSYEGKRALFDYLESYEEDVGQEIDLDIIALCCDYNEYEDLNEYLRDYNTDLNEEDYETEEEFKEAVLEELENKTTIIKIGDSEGFIIQAY